MGRGVTRMVWLRGKQTRVALFGRTWRDETETTALYIEHDEPLPSLWVKRWRDLPHILIKLETKQ